MPIFNKSSSAIRSSPQVGLFSAVSPISLRTSTGTRGRPADRDFHFQNNRNPFRCRRISVSGFTTVRASASRRGPGVEPGGNGRRRWLGGGFFVARHIVRGACGETDSQPRRPETFGGEV